jgi:superfamily II DNA or RNA helicase
LIADDAGLGKTIMTGMLLKELKARKRVENALFVVPAPLQKQWAREMREKFDEEFRIYDSSYLKSLRYTLAPNENPWKKDRQIVTSIDFVRQDAIREQLNGVEWDFVIFDEAHKLSAYKFGDKVDKTERYKVADVIKDNCEALLLLTATPHKGETYPFFALLHLLDPYLFPSEEYLSRKKLENVMIRRLKEEVKKFDGSPLFPPREVKTLTVEYNEDEWKLYNEVTDYVTHYYNMAMKEEKRSIGFAMVILQKRMVSSIYSIKKSLENRKGRLEELKKRGEIIDLTDKEQTRLEQYREDPEMFTDSEKEEIEKKLEALTAATRPEELQREINKLKDLIALADQITVDSKAESLVEFINEILEKDPKEKVLIFTEYKDTLDYLVGIFEKWDPAIIHGGMNMDRREYEEEKFKKTNLMIATDAAGEGLNLQFAHIMVNYELPWNPNKIEQRMGRLHRYGQKKKVEIFNLLITGTKEGDIFEGILRKLDTIREEMGERTFDVIGELLSEINIEELVMTLLAERDVKPKLMKIIDAKIEEKKELIAEKIEEESLIKDRLNLDPLKELMKTSKIELIDEGDLIRFLKVFFDNLDGKMSEVKKGVFRLRPPFEIIDDKGVKRLYEKAAFSRERVKESEEELDFIAIGHPLMDRTMFYTMRWEWGGRVVVKISPECKSGVLLTYLSKIRDGTGAVVEEKLTNYFVSNGNLQQISSKAIWDFEDTGGKIDGSAKLKKIVGSIDETAQLSLGKALEEAKNLATSVKEKRQKYIGIKRRDAQKYYEKRIEESEKRIARYEKQAKLGKDMRIAIEKERYNIDKDKATRTKLLSELEQEENVSPESPELIGVAIILPKKKTCKNVKDVELKKQIEIAAMKIVEKHEKSQGRTPSDVSKEYKGYDFESNGTDETRYIEVKGLMGEGMVEITENEWFMAQKLQDEYWLYVVEHALDPEKNRLNLIRNPAKKFVEKELLERIILRIKIDNWKDSVNNVVQI